MAESPACSPGIATAPKDLPSSGKRIRTQDAASPISERIAQAPSPIRALHFGPAKGEVEDVAPVFPGATETVPEDLRQVEPCEETLSRERAERPTLVFMPSAKPGTPGAAPLAAPAAFAQDSIIEPTEEVHVPRPAEWHSKALFEKPPDSPLRRPKAAPARPKPVAELPQASPERKELTPMKVADRIMMFEKIISPSVRCVAGGVAMSSSARLGQALGSARGSATCSNERSSGRAVDGSSLFTPVQQPWARPDVKPKELFRSTSDLALKPRSKPTEIPRPRAKLAAPPRKPPGGHHHGAPIPRGADKENADSREALDRHGISNLPQKREALKPRLKVLEATPVVELKRATPQPMYKDPALEIRAMTLPPKKPEDNYAISEYGGDSKGEDAAERDKMRQKKQCPSGVRTISQAFSSSRALIQIPSLDVCPDASWMMFFLSPCTSRWVASARRGAAALAAIGSAIASREMRSAATSRGWAKREVGTSRRCRLQHSLRPLLVPLSAA